MGQDGKACVEALVTAASLAGDTAPYWDHGLPERSQPNFEDCQRPIPNLPSGARVANMEQVEVRLEPESRGFTLARERLTSRSRRAAQPKSFKMGCSVNFSTGSTRTSRYNC